MSSRERVIVSYCMLALLIAATIPQESHSATINVPADAGSIQAGINASSHGDTVLVAPGTYYENIRLNGKRIVLTSQYALAGDTSLITSTTIHGGIPAQPDTASVILVIDHEDARTVIQGFTIRGGEGTRWNDEHGFGFFREGGGILCAFSSPTIKHNRIIENAITNDAGVVSTGGGGIRAGDAGPRILSNRFEGNYGKYGGAIVLNHPSGAVVKNNIIVNNLAEGAYGGGAVWVNTPSGGTVIENNTIYGNSSPSGTGGLRGVGSGTASVRNCVVWANSPTQLSGTQFQVTYTDINQAIGGVGNLNITPTFLDLLDFIPDDTSVIIDAGNPDAVYNDVEDGGNPGSPLYPARGTLRNDMGAYGGSAPDLFDRDADGTIDILDNCPDFANPDQLDTDGDGFGDFCEGDDDNDGLGDFSDNCPLVYNPGQEDQDGEAIGDVCDNCPTVSNFDQADTDQDGIGDACDCQCDCASDPAPIGSCDGATDILDVGQVINVAFRGADPIPDPNGNCPYLTTDVNCTGATDIIDVGKMINVAFRGASVSTEFCNPCPIP